MQKKTEAKIRERFLVNPWKIFFWEVFLFSLTLSLGMATTLRAGKILEKEKISPPSISFSQFLVQFLLINLFVFLFLFFGPKKGKGPILKILFLFSLTFAILILLNTWVPNIFSFILTLILVLLFVKKPSVLIHDLLMVFAMAGAGSALGLSLKPEIVVALLLVFSIYDFIAVYKTKHMIKMAREMTKKGAIMALIIPRKISDFGDEIKKVKPGGKFLILGGGDVIFPLLFCSSLISERILNALVVAVFSVFGLLASFLIFVFQRKRRPIPALPPIALFLIIGFLITRIL